MTRITPVEKSTDEAKQPLWGLIAAGLILIGTVLPWYSVSSVEVIGLNDFLGTFVFIFGLAAFLILLSPGHPFVQRHASEICGIPFGFILILTLFDLTDLGRYGITPGLGLLLAFTGSVAGLATAVVNLRDLFLEASRNTPKGFL